MEIRKSEKADLQNKRLLFTEIGCIAALALVYFCFEFTTGKIRTTSLEDTNVITDVEDLIPITFDTPPPPPAAPAIPVLSDVIDIIEDDIIINDTFISIEDNPAEGIVIYDYIEVIEEEVEEAEIPFMMVEQKPLFNGGDANAFSKWVNQRLVYPETCKENGISGRVVLSFTIRKDGTLADAKVVRGVHPDIDREALRVINSSPKWTPGKQRDRAVAVSYTFPVIFMLR